MHCGKKWWIREFVPPYIFPLNLDYVAARSLRSLRSNKPWSHLVDAASPRTISIIRKKISSGTPGRLQAIYSKLRLLKFTRDDVPRSRIQGKKRVEGGRANAKSFGATDWQYSRTDDRNSSPVNSQLSSLKKELTWQIEDFSCDHVLIPSNIRSYPRQTLNNRRCSETKRG